ncbi:MAG: 2-amino-4-hydroxy-6-hydroxymethyldihydropteridine diphosphokinase [Muribaculaceae bacterium]|nr:2-amino-4-hydroxy-6-hydroxymethyldihydropteridine diphosphokinase [Muribaculaceae bacterium]MDE6321847.1 2-amino-4-hydroxy-6-hydroxymethyldihydropteridine diphosphokinase [Muribaculaceae bacterium]
MTAYLNLGTNIGDRLFNLEQAIALIEWLSGERCRLSRVIESEPWGFESPHPFLNVGVALRWDKDPLELLNITQQAEEMMGSTCHRDASGAYIDRLIDIDIIAIGDIRLNHPRLTLPHPRAHLRTFVTIPMRELNNN